MLEIVTNTEILQVALALPIVIAGAVAAWAVRRQRRALLPAIVAYAVFTALIGGMASIVAEAAALAGAELRALYIAIKFAAAFGLMLVLGASGLSARRHSQPAA